MSAFGPYKDKVEIDFSKFSDNDIFLITGDTGSGKTTIFDAMVFALFGEASGSRRDNSSFRSDFAESDVNTYVEFEFRHKGILYKIERTPSYYRAKKRGNGVTKSVGDASLTYLDKVITGDKSVSEECVSILGMTSSQFKQIVMIAQGEFLDLLFAKTKDRAAIFRRIFDTSIYKNISDKLKGIYLEKKREYEDSFLTINSYIQGIIFDEVDIENKSTDEILKLLSKEINKDLEIENSFEKEKNGLSSKSSKIVKIISEGKIINNSILTLKESKDKLSILIKEEKEISDLENIVQKNDDIWNKVMPKYERFNNLNKEFSNKEKELSNVKLEQEQVSNEFKIALLNYEKADEKSNLLQKNRQKVEIIDNRIDLLKGQKAIEEELFILLNERKTLELNEKRAVINKFSEFKQGLSDIEKIRNEITTLRDEYVFANKMYMEHYDLFLSAQAGILASNLFDGQACPVCGSLKHPNKAQFTDSVLSREELDAEKISNEKKYQDIEKLIIDLSLKEQLAKTIEKELSIYDEDSVKEEISKLEKELDRYLLDNEFKADDIDIHELENSIQRKEIELEEIKSNFDSHDDISSLKDELKKLEIDNERLEKEINKSKVEYENLLKEKTRLDALHGVLDKTANDLREKIVSADKEYINSYKELGYKVGDEYISIRKDKEELSKLKKRINNYYNQIIELKSNISSLEQVIGERKEIKLDIYDEELKVVNEQIKEVEMSLKNINNKISNNKKIYDKLLDVSKNTTKLEQEVVIYKDLADTANGTITGKNKLEFEQYVQAGYFDNVLVAANKRFKYMTDDRYKLVRKEEASKVSDKLGLELEVMDYYTGKRRDIKSLSGGEAFKASLSLALGMSDTIQEYSGGVVVDAMFIDEGFGSLDDESLESAMNAIMLLSQNNKLIGIISHVNELKSRIDKKIIINKGNIGSSISLVV